MSGHAQFGQDGDWQAMIVIGLRGDRVRLVPLERSLHLNNAYGWLNDPVVNATLASNLGVTRRMEEDFFDRFEAKRDGDVYWGVHDETNRHIGIVGLGGLGLPHRSAAGSLMIGERDAWGKGYGTESLCLRNRVAFDQLGLHRVEGHTINPAMARIYEKCGYTREGVARQKFWRDGCWHDVWYYAILSTDRRTTDSA